MKRFLIIGLGISGKAAATYLLNQQHTVIAVDPKADSLRNNSDIQPLLSQGLTLHTNLSTLPNIDQVILSPGVSPEIPLVKQALSAHIEVIGEAEFALRRLDNPAIAITGTNGKTTVTLLLEHLLLSSGRAAKAVGNVGLSLSEYLLHPSKNEILVVELSSFQLETLTKPTFTAGIVLNITPDHLDRYASFRDYAKTKALLARTLLPHGKLFISKQIQKEWNDLFREAHLFDATPISLDLPISNRERLKAGIVEEKNLQAIYAMAKTLGLSDREIAEGVKTFRKSEHRIEWVAEIDRVDYYNDSKATNIDSVMHAVELFDGPLILLAGGVDKGASYAPWKEAFLGKVKRIIAFGKAAPLMEQELKGDFHFTKVNDLFDALLLAKSEAKEADTVLLSPGCSSYDQFQNYAHRGQTFKEIVRSWKGEK